MRANEDDSCLVEACIKKDIIAWERLIKKYSGLVYISIENRLKKYGIMASGHDIEEIKQDIFTDIWQNNKLSGVVKCSDISYWMAILSGNAAIEHFRSRPVRQAQKTVSIFDKIGQEELSEFLPSESVGPKDELSRAELETEFEETIESLPEKEKIVIKLHIIYDKGYYEIAEILGMPKGTVSSCIKRAKEKLREALKDF